MRYENVVLWSWTGNNDTEMRGTWGRGLYVKEKAKTHSLELKKQRDNGMEMKGAEMMEAADSVWEHKAINIHSQPTPPHRPPSPRSQVPWKSRRQEHSLLPFQALFNSPGVDIPLMWPNGMETETRNDSFRYNRPLM